MRYEMKNKIKKNKRKIDFKYNLSVYWGFLKKYKLLMFGLLFMILIHESKQVVDRFLFKIIIDRGTEFMAGTLLRPAFVNILLVVAIVFVFAAISSILTNWFRVHFLNRIETKMIVDLKRKFFNHILSLDHNFHTSNKTGSLISRVIRGAGAIERMTDVIAFNFLTIFFQLTIITFSLVFLDIVSAIIIFTTVVIFVAYSFYLQRLQAPANLEVNSREDIEKANISDILTNIDSVKYFGKEKLIEKRYVNLSDKTREAQVKHWDYFKWMSAGQSLILATGTFFLIYLSILKFLDGTITLGTLTFVYTLYYGLIGQMFGFVHGLRGFYRSMADFQDLFQYGKMKNEIKDKPSAKEIEIKEGSVELKNVGFNYGKRKMFENFNLKIKPNEKIALVGHSGCGKTTLIKLINRFYDVDSGEILIDGGDIRNFEQESIRGETGIVPQECILFDDSLYNNIKFADPKASREEIMKAIKFAQLDKIINEFPRRENTIVGERGVKLSGGEKQRVSIARAILANKKILILDEATSALDSETEYEIQKDLQKLLQGRTSIIIAHRLSTIMNADRIIVMKKGKIIQQGSHSDLIKQKGEYNKLWNLQKGGYIE